MNKCLSCGIFVNDDTDTCPLCHTVLVSEEGEREVINKYPDIPNKKRAIVFLGKVMLFACIISSAICIYINYRMGFKPPWSVIVTVCVFYAYSLVLLLSSKYTGYRRRIFFAIFLGVLGTLIIDVAFGFKRWSVNFVLPGALCFLCLVLILLMIINRRNWQSYMNLQVLMILIGALPMAGIKLGIVTHPEVSEIAFFASIIVFIGTVIFGGRTASAELKRRFHI